MSRVPATPTSVTMSKQMPMSRNMSRSGQKPKTNFMKYFIQKKNNISFSPKTTRMIIICHTFICLLGMIYQSSFITDEYFKYPVISSTLLSQADDYLLPSISNCFRDFEIFGYEAYNQKHGKNLTYRDWDAEVAYQSGLDLHQEITVGDLLQFTPTEEDFINNCEIRNASSFEYHYYNKSECYEHFDVKKFYIAAQICYTLTLKHSRNGSKINVYNRESAYFTPSDSGSLLYVFLNQSGIARYDALTIVLHPIDSNPWYDFPLAQIAVRRFNGKTLHVSDNIFGAKSSSIQVLRQAPPYETMCTNYSARYGYADSMDCFLKCIRRPVEDTFQRASLINHYYPDAEKHNQRRSSLKLKLMNNEDFKEKGFDLKYQSIIDKCSKKCPDNDCMFESTYTRTHGLDYPFPGIFVMLPDVPSFVIKYKEKVLFTDTIAFVCSALGFWFGFSMYSLNLHVKKYRKGNGNENENVSKLDGGRSTRNGTNFKSYWKFSNDLPKDDGNGHEDNNDMIMSVMIDYIRKDRIEMDLMRHQIQQINHRLKYYKQNGDKR